MSSNIYRFTMKTYWTPKELSILQQHSNSIKQAVAILGRSVTSCESKLSQLKQKCLFPWQQFIDLDFSNIYRQLNQTQVVQRPVYNVYLPTSGPGDDFFKQLDQMQFE